jgi:L-asparaginase
VELANGSSAAVTADDAFLWARKVDEELAGPEYSGAVVTVGTDTLEEVAYLFDLIVRSPKPLVFTGAMRVASDLMTDGMRNLRSALRVATETSVRGMGVLVVLNDEIHAARDVTKGHSEAIQAFESPGYGPLGVLSRSWAGEEVLVRRSPRVREHIPARRIETRVCYVKTVLGSNSAMIDAARDTGARGIVIESFGGGEITPSMADGVERALADGIAIVLATSASRGRPLDTWAGRGEGHWLRERGVLFADTLTGPKARIKLMLALGLDRPERLSSWFA